MLNILNETDVSINRYKNVDEFIKSYHEPNKHYVQDANNTHII